MTATAAPGGPREAPVSGPQGAAAPGLRSGGSEERATRATREDGAEKRLFAPERSEAMDREPDFWSFVDLAGRRLSEEFGFPHPLATRLLLTLNRASAIVTYDLESTVHRPRGRSWAGFRLLFVTWLAGPLEPARAATLAGMSRAAVSNLVKTLVADGLMARTPGERDGRSAILSLTERGSGRCWRCSRRRTSGSGSGRGC